jgi:lysophospholipase L1-like esterase
VNLAVSGATVGSALAGQVSRAEALDADVVTVWLVVNDIIAGVDVETYESRFDELVARLSRGGTARLLVGNCPYLDRMPAYIWGSAAGFLPEPGEANAIVDAYNGAIERVVARHDATLVDLRTAALAARQAGTEPSLFAADGFHPSTGGHRALAACFANALQGESTELREMDSGRTV